MGWRRSTRRKPVWRRGKRSWWQRLSAGSAEFPKQAHDISRTSTRCHDDMHRRQRTCWVGVTSRASIGDGAGWNLSERLALQDVTLFEEVGVSVRCDLYSLLSPKFNIFHVVCTHDARTGFIWCSL